MDGPTATVLAALIALVGTLVGVVFAYRRWSQEKQSVRFGKFEDERQSVYRTLWDRIEGINVALRRERVDGQRFQELVADLNEFMLRHGAHLGDEDRVLANRYVQAVQVFDAAVRESGEDAQIPYGTTQDIPLEVVQRARKLSKAQEEATTLRDELRRKVRVVLSGSP